MEKNRGKLASFPANDDNTHQAHAPTITYSITGFPFILSVIFEREIKSEQQKNGTPHTKKAFWHFNPSEIYVQHEKSFFPNTVNVYIFNEFCSGVKVFEFYKKRLLFFIPYI